MDPKQRSCFDLYLHVLGVRMGEKMGEKTPAPTSRSSDAENTTIREWIVGGGDHGKTKTAVAAMVEVTAEADLVQQDTTSVSASANRAGTQTQQLQEFHTRIVERDETKTETGAHGRLPGPTGGASPDDSAVAPPAEDEKPEKKPKRLHNTQKELIEEGAREQRRERETAHLPLPLLLVDFYNKEPLLCVFSFIFVAAIAAGWVWFLWLRGEVEVPQLRGKRGPAEQEDSLGDSLPTSRTSDRTTIVDEDHVDRDRVVAPGKPADTSEMDLCSAQSDDVVSRSTDHSSGEHSSDVATVGGQDVGRAAVPSRTTPTAHGGRHERRGGTAHGGRQEPFRLE